MSTVAEPPGETRLADLLAACRTALSLLNDRRMARCLPSYWTRPDEVRAMLRGEGMTEEEKLEAAAMAYLAARGHKMTAGALAALLMHLAVEEFAVGSGLVLTIPLKGGEVAVKVN